MLYGDTYGRHKMIDSFEGPSPLSNYTGDTGKASIVDSATVSPIDGANSLAITNDQSTASFWEIDSSSGLYNYPAKGDEFDVWIRTTNIPTSLHVTFIFGRADGNNKWTVRLEDDSFQVTAFYGGSATSYTDTLFSPSTGTWYRMNVKWDDGSTFGGNDGDVTLELFDGGTSQGAVTATESRLTTAGIGFGMQSDVSGHSAYYDYGHIV